jgi:choline dehydrogenase
MYDYVIVGAGSAGCALAARLSEDPDTKVCLVEAGPADTSPNIHVPALFSKLLRSGLDWDYDTHDEPGLNGRRLFLPRGRVLGGTSSINTQIYIRGNRLDYDSWDQPGWGYDELLPYFKRSEDNEWGESDYHGAGGPMRVSDNRSRNAMSTAFVEAAVEAGFAANDDFNGESQDGFGYFQLTQKDGRRVSASTAFLHPNMGRPNLTVLTNVQVHRIVIENGFAVGVTGERFGEELTVRADREVILSAGAYGSPHLLQLSGIGPAQGIAPLGIPVVADLPGVGANLQDHVLIPLVFPHEHPISMIGFGQPEHLEQFGAGHGPLTCNGPEVGGFHRTDSSLPAPDVEYLSAPVAFVDNGLGVPVGHAITFGPSMLTPRSRGAVSLASDDPTVKPRIQHNFFTEQADMDDAVKAVRTALEISRQKALSPYCSTLYRGPASESDADIAGYIRAYTHSIFHPVGTCAIGSVVDPELRVQGVGGLRVADASVMPLIPRGNTNAPSIAIGEKAADLIRKGTTA